METDLIPTGDTEISGVPTRWGNSLNGNLIFSFRPSSIACRPHSLGKLIEWKLVLKNTLANSTLVPTRWGNSLNGNQFSLDELKAGLL